MWDLKVEQQRYNPVFETGLQFSQDYEYLINHPIAINALAFSNSLNTSLTKFSPVPPLLPASAE
jgi:hypothetical protein